MRRFEYRVGSSNKFWEISLSKSTYAVRYGRIGTDGQSSEKAFASDSEAKRAYEKIVAEKVKSGYVEVIDATSKATKPAASDHKKTPAKTAAASGEVEVHDRASFEKAFGPIKKVGAVNNGLLDCRLPGENYYDPDRNATPPLFTSRLWTTGFFPKDADGTNVSDWRGLGEAVSIARRIAAALKGVVLSSDTDSPYYPFVFPEPFDGKGIAKYVHGALGCQAKGARHFELEKTKNPDNLFWESDEEPEEYFSEGDVKRCRAAAAIFRTLEGPVRIRMTEDFVTSPQLLAGRTKSGWLVGVIAFRADT
jgi:predicted DNA-binding WGR domain protein